MDTPIPSQVDLAIIGGGINGAGLAAQAAQAGYSVALFEKGDFASGTSSKSTKLIHGGIRYLEQGRFSLVFEALHERRRLLGTAPHLVRPIPFLLPCYQDDQRPPWMLRMGLWLYDLLSGSKNIARHDWYSPSQAMEKAPTLNPDGLKGCGLYYDAQVNDSRLVLENILAAERTGAVCLNFCAVTQLAAEENGVRVFYHDARSGGSGTTLASCLVNASGPWANQTAQLLSNDSLKLVRPTRGSHIVVPMVLDSHAVLVMTPKDKRVIFVIPWRGYSLVGTTDLDDPGDPGKVEPTEEEIQYLLTEASRVFPGARWERNRVIAAFSGLRPLAWSDGGHASSVSREDRILKDDRVLTIVGGKLTTYRAMAEKALRLVSAVTGKARASALSVSLPGTPASPWDEFQRVEIPQWISSYRIPEITAKHLAGLYGQRAKEVLALLKDNPSLREPLHPERPELSAQVVYAVQNEKAVHLEDVLIRRLEIGYSRERWGAASEKASRIMADLLGWNEEQRKRELEQYRQNLRPAPRSDAKS